MKGFICLLCLVAIGCGGQAVQTATRTAPSSQPNKTVVVSQPLGQCRLIIAYEGEPPRLVREGCLKGEGMFYVDILDPQSRAVFHVSIGEIDPPLAADYSQAQNGTLVLTYYTRDPRTPENDPAFVEETIHVRGIVVTKTARVVLKADRYDPARAREMVDSIKKGLPLAREDEPDPLEFVLGHLRNMGIDNPTAMLELLKELNGKVGTHGQEILDSVEGDLSWVKEIRGKQSSSRSKDFKQD